MDVIVRSNNNTVNDMTTPVSGLINDLDKVMETKSSQSQSRDRRGNDLTSNPLGGFICGLINDLDKAMKTKSIQSLFG